MDVHSKFPKRAGVAELADAADSKSAARKSVGVRVPPPAPAETLLKLNVYAHYELTTLAVHLPLLPHSFPTIPTVQPA